MLDIILLIIGITVGAFILELVDPAILAYISHPELPTSKLFKSLVASRNIKAILCFWKANRFTNEHYTLHSLLFQPILIVVTYFALFIVGNRFTVGMLVSAIIGMSVRQVMDMQQFKHLNFWIWPIKGGMSNIATKIYLGTVTILSLGTLLLLF